MDQDVLDRMLQKWLAQRKDVDLSGYHIVGRILLLAKHFQNSASTHLAPYGLDLPGFEVLVTLWQEGPPCHLSPTELCRAAMLSSGGMTNRLDRLEASGFVARHPDPDDRRSLIIELTPQGKDVVEKALAARLEEAKAAVAPLSEAEAQELARLLRKLLASRSGTPFHGGDDA